MLLNLQIPKLPASVWYWGVKEETSLYSASCRTHPQPPTKTYMSATGSSPLLRTKSPRSEFARPPGTLEEVHAEVQKTQAELHQALNRIAVLERQVSSLQQANAKLEKAIQGFDQPRLVPLEHK